jgi:hypothetical protein
MAYSRHGDLIVACCRPGICSSAQKSKKWQTVDQVCEIMANSRHGRQNSGIQQINDTKY